MSVERERKRVVVSGVGAITPHGTNADALWEHVRKGDVAIRKVDHLPMEGYMTEIGGEVKEQAPPEHDYDHPDDYREPIIDFALKASEEAVEQCGVHASGQIPPERWGVVVGTCNAGLLSAEKWYREKTAGENPDPRLLLLSTPQALAESIAGAFGAKGPVLSVNTACAASANAIGYASELIRDGQADAVLTGGAEALSGILYSGFNCLESLSPDPAAPYSRDRHGLSLGEGSGMMVLLREDLARELGAPILAEILGYSLSADGYHPTAPHPEGEGAGRAIKGALRAAGVDPNDVAYVNSHGTVSSTKSMIGHLLGAAGAVENIVTVRAVEQQVAPPTANYREPDPECDLDYVPNEPREMQIPIAVSNNFAFGGANASVVWARANGRTEAPPVPNLDRVVITGVATLTSAGTDPNEVLQAFTEKRQVTRAENGTWVGRTDFDPAEFMTPKERRRVDRLGLWSIIAARQALKDAGLEISQENRGRVGAIIGTGVGPMESMEAFSRPVFEEGPGAANPAIFPNTVYNAAGGQVAMQVGVVGVTSTVTAGHAAGAQSVSYAYDLLRCDHADAIVSLATDTLTDAVIQGYQDLGVLAKGEPGGPDAQGFALAEGSVGLVLERLSHAQARGAKPLAEVLGYAVTSDAEGVGRVDPEGHGIEAAMRSAIERAGLQPGDIGTIWANASGLEVVDEAERHAIERVFGDGANVVMPKLLFGEPMGMGGSLNAALAVQSWRSGDDARPALVNSLSFGGTNISIVLGPQ
ncbi:MAG: 3-ketoacyl-ACP synthase [Actinobacteria bacterium]|nr:MAG: 3-ketoacyl-ACP synthase [Actinomycetota bacterium]